MRATLARVSLVILLIGIASALATLNAFLPVRGRWLGILSFFMGWLTIELALHMLVFNAALIGALAAYGGLGAPHGQFGLGLALASSVGTRSSPWKVMIFDARPVSITLPSMSSAWIA